MPLPGFPDATSVAFEPSMWATAIRDYLDACGNDTDAMLAIAADLGFLELHQGLADGTLDSAAIRMLAGLNNR